MLIKLYDAIQVWKVATFSVLPQFYFTLPIKFVMSIDIVVLLNRFPLTQQLYQVNEICHSSVQKIKNQYNMYALLQFS